MMPSYELPGPKSAEYIAMSEKYESPGTTRQVPLVWESAQGVHVKDVDGNEYIDWTSGVLVANVGHCHPYHVKAIQEAAAKLLNCYDFPTPGRVTLAKRLVEITPENLDKAFLLSTGSEATEAAMRIAKRYTGKHEILSFFGGFHGRTWGAMSMAGSPGTKGGWGPLMPGTIYGPFPYCYRCPFKKEPETCGMFCIEYLDTVLKTQSIGDVAALIIEPYQGGAGFIFPPRGYLPALQRWAKEHDILFILDEVQSSFGRTGKLFMLEHENLSPNFLCLGKGLASGVPTAALMAEARIMDILSSGDLSSTTGGNPLSCAAVHAVLDIMEKEDLPGNAARVGAYIKERLTNVMHDVEVLGDVRGLGMVIGLEFVNDKASKEPAPDITWEFLSRMCSNGVIVGRVGMYGNIVRVAPPLVMTMEEAEESCDIAEKVLRSL